jgi:hypothetical protein
LVGCDSRGVNAFFVNDLEAGAFTRRSVREHYVGPRYGLPFGHPLRPVQLFEAPPVPPGESEFVRLHVAPPWPTAARAGGLVFVHATVENQTSVPIGHPTSTSSSILLASWWLDGTGVRLDETSERSIQPWRADPGETAHLVGRITAPDSPGQFTPVFALVQEFIQWFGSPSLVTLGPVTVACGR